MANSASLALHDALATARVRLADPANNPESSQPALDRLYDCLLLAKASLDAPTLEAIALLAAALQQPTNDEIARLDRLSKLCGAISRLQPLSGVERHAQYGEALAAIDLTLGELGPTLRGHLQAARQTQFDPRDRARLAAIARRLALCGALLPACRDRPLFRELQELTLRLQVVLVCQYSLEALPAKARRRQESDKLIRLLDRAGIYIGNPAWKQGYAYCYESALIEAKTYSCYEYPERYEPALQDLGEAFLALCDRAPATLDRAEFAPLLDRVRRSGWAVKEKDYQQLWDRFLATRGPQDPRIPQIATWLAALDTRKDNERSRQRVLVWLSLVAWPSEIYRPVQINFPTWVGNNLWRILQRLKAQHKPETEAIPLPPEILAQTLEDTSVSAEAEATSERWHQLLATVEADRDGALAGLQLKGYAGINARVLCARYLRYERDDPSNSRKNISFNEVMEGLVVELGLAAPQDKKAFKNTVAKLGYFFKTKCVPALEKLWLQF